MMYASADEFAKGLGMVELAEQAVVHFPAPMQPKVMEDMGLETLRGDLRMLQEREQRQKQTQQQEGPASAEGKKAA